MKLLIFPESLPVPMLMCIAWYSLDVLFTSSTICHLCMISIDRYMTLTYPLKYGHAKKKKHTILKIAIVWVISFCIAGPLFILSTLDTHEDTVQYKGCGPETPTFVISATVTSFYLPLLIMTVMYALTVRALQQQLREQRRMTVTNSCNRSRTSSRADSSSIFYCPSRKASAPSSSLLGDLSPQLNYSSCDIQPQRNPLFKQHSLQRDPAGSSLTIDEPFQEASPVVVVVQGNLLKAHSQSLKLKSTHSLTTNEHRSVHSNSSGRYLMVTGNSPWGEGQIAYSLAGGGAASKEGSEIALNDVATDFDVGLLGSQGNLASPPSSNDKSRFRFNRSFTFRRSVSSTGSRRGASSPDKGRRAVQVLGILFAVFVICYLPFFAVYVIKGTCIQCQSYISPHLLIALEWLAYSGSMLNPIIYHIFNPDFRRAFQNLLSCSSCPCCATAAPRSRKHELPVCRIDTV